MNCNKCQKPIIDTNFKKTKKHYYHLDKCWGKVKKFYSIVLPSILGAEFLGGIIAILFLVFILPLLI